MLNTLKKLAQPKSLFTIIKFIFAAILVALTLSTTKNITYLVVGYLELILIFFIYNAIVEIKPVFRVLAGLLFFIFVAQMLVLYFGNSFVTLTMLKNVKFLEDLGGKIFTYIAGIVLVLFVVFIPGKAILSKLNKKILIGLITVLVIAECFIFINYKHFSPVQSFATLISSEIRYQHVKKAQVNPELALETYYKDSLADTISKPANLPENPNIILIFTEGLSYNIISDERNIMPNLKEFEKSCISFKNYYNHTFPTLRGVQGQLYSGYKLDDDELGNNLISIQDVLENNGYFSAFVNVEPYNKEFNAYCANLGFDQIITDTRHVSGYNISMTDKEIYDFLFSYAIELEEGTEPFFLTTYTFGTHVSFDSPDEVYGDGSDAELNKFYNLDAQFGEFIDRFNNSFLATNTILVFTTDHSTYADQDYTSAFPDYKRACTDVDQVPLFIYYAGITPKEVDVQGKNSLCLAPTLLDYLDIDCKNYFLGSSLFDTESSTGFDTTFYDASYLISTKDAEIRHLDDLEVDEFLSQVLAYYSAVEAPQ